MHGTVLIQAYSEPSEWSPSSKQSSHFILLAAPRDKHYDSILKTRKPEPSTGLLSLASIQEVKPDPDPTPPCVFRVGASIISIQKDTTYEVDLDIF